VPLEECEALWAANQSVDHHDVCLLHGWHLNRARVPVPLPPPAGPKLDAEIRCRIRNLLEAPWLDRKYRKRQFWYDFLAWEHTSRHRITRHHDYQPWESYNIAGSPDKEDKDNKDYHVVKEEADVAMEDAAPPQGAGVLPPEYQAVVAGGYDEEALLQQVLKASKAEEDARFPDLQEALTLTGMVA
jgi:hypothetical protein